jgi:hypothetical protein
LWTCAVASVAALEASSAIALALEMSGRISSRTEVIACCAVVSVSCAFAIACWVCLAILATATMTPT